MQTTMKNLYRTAFDYASVPKLSSANSCLQDEKYKHDSSLVYLNYCSNSSFDMFEKQVNDQARWAACRGVHAGTSEGPPQNVLQEGLS